MLQIWNLLCISCVSEQVCSHRGHSGRPRQLSSHEKSSGYMPRYTYAVWVNRRKEQFSLGTILRHPQIQGFAWQNSKTWAQRRTKFLLNHCSVCQFFLPLYYITKFKVSRVVFLTSNCNCIFDQSRLLYANANWYAHIYPRKNALTFKIMLMNLKCLLPCMPIPHPAKCISILKVLGKMVISFTSPRIVEIIANYSDPRFEL